MRTAEAEIAALPPGPVTIRPTVLLAWGMGSFTTSILVNAVALLHMRYMTDSLGIAAVVAGTLIGTSKLYDAFIDPLIGAISDRAQTRLGRRRPFLFVGTFACAMAMVLMFNVPRFESQQSLVVYMLIILLFFNTAYSLFRTPYLALLPEITETFAQRSRLAAVNVFGSAVGSVFATVFAPFLLSSLGSNREGHGHIALLLGILILVGGLGCFAGTGTIPSVRMRDMPSVDWRTRWRALMENQPFLVLICFKTILFTGFFTHSVAIPFVMRHALKISDAWLGTLYLARTATMLASQPAWAFVAGRLGRRNTLFAAGLCEACCMAGWFFVTPENAVYTIVLAGMLQGLSSGGMFFGLYAALPDTMEYDRRCSGLQREGIFAGIFVMVEKFTAAASNALFGIMLGLFGFIASKDAEIAQPENAIAGMYVALSVVPALLALAACFILRFYRLSESDLKATIRRP